MSPALPAPGKFFFFIKKMFASRRAILFVLPFLLAPADWPLGRLPALPPCSAPPFSTTDWLAAWYPSDPLLVWRAGRIRFAENDVSGALCYFQTAESAMAQNATFLSEYGDALWEDQQPLQAVAVWGKITAPTIDMRMRLAQGYESLREWAAAEDAYGAVLREDPNNILAQFRNALLRSVREPAVGVSLLEQVTAGGGPWASRAESLRGALLPAIRGGNPAYMFAVVGQELIRQEEWPLAAEALAQAVARDPHYGEAFALLGLAREGSGGDPEQAYQKATQLSPDSQTVCLLYGSWLRRTGKNDLARMWLLRAWEIAPGDITVASELAQVEYRMGYLTLAISRVDGALAAHPKELAAWLAAAEFYIENEVAVAAQGIFAARQALLLDPGNARGLFLFGKGLYLTADFLQAEAFLRRAVEASPLEQEPRFYLGVCQMELGWSSTAIESLDATINLNPGSVWAQKARSILARIAG